MSFDKLEVQPIEGASFIDENGNEEAVMCSRCDSDGPFIALPNGILICTRGHRFGSSLFQSEMTSATVARFDHLEPAAITDDDGNEIVSPRDD